jgi:hypothetical protein
MRRAASPVALEGGACLVEPPAVHLDHEARLWPQRVDFIALNQCVHPWA